MGFSKIPQQLRLLPQRKCPTHIRLKAYLLKCLQTSRQPWIRLRFDIIAESFGVTDRTLRRAKRRLEHDPDLKFRTLSKGRGSGWQVIVGQEAKLLWDKEPLFYKRWREGYRSRNVKDRHCGYLLEDGLIGTGVRLPPPPPSFTGVKSTSGRVNSVLPRPKDHAADFESASSPNRESVSEAGCCPEAKHNSSRNREGFEPPLPLGPEPPTYCLTVNRPTVDKAGRRTPGVAQPASSHPHDEHAHGTHHQPTRPRNSDYKSGALRPPPPDPQSDALLRGTPNGQGLKPPKCLPSKQSVVGSSPQGSLTDTPLYRERRTRGTTAVKTRNLPCRDRLFACSGTELRRLASGKQLRLAYFEARSAIAWHVWDNCKVKGQPELLKSLWLAGLLAGYTPKQIERAFAKALTVSHGLATDIGLLEDNYRFKFEMSHTVAEAKRILSGIEPASDYIKKTSLPVSH